MNSARLIVSCFIILLSYIGYGFRQANHFLTGNRKKLCPYAYGTLRHSKSNDDEGNLNLDDIASLWSKIQYGQDGDYILESRNKAYYDEYLRIEMSRVGGMGLALTEVDRGEGEA
jgi:hypothetical protein